VKRVRSWLLALPAAAGLLCVLTVQAATLNAAVDRTAIEDGDIVQLTLEIEGRNSDRPDTTALERDFEVLGTSSITQMNLVNGSATSSTRWTLNLRPRRLGTLTIPSMQSGAARSRPITIRVAQSRRSQGANPDVFLESEVNPRSPYVQAQLRYTVRLFHAIDLRSGQISAPRVDDVLIHRAGEDSQYEVTRGGRRYKVFERHYILFAQHSGELTLEAPVFEGQVLDSSTRRQSRRGRLFGIEPFFARTRPVRVRGEPKKILIRPRPAAARGRDWVPALALELSGGWEPQQTAVRIGDPLTLNLTTTARGLTGAQLPEVMPSALDGFSVYPDRAEVTTVFTAQGDTSGTRMQKIVVIPKQAGTLTIPDIVLRWWNTQTDREEFARLPGITLSVEGDPATSGTIPVAASTVEDGALTPAAAQPLSATRIWVWLSALFAVAWLVTVVLWMRERRRAGSSLSQRADGSASQATSERIARTRIAQACTRNDAVAARRELLAWGASHWSEDPPRGLEQIALLLDDQNLRRALLALDRALYAETKQWNASELKSLLPSRRGRARRCHCITLRLRHANALRARVFRCWLPRYCRSELARDSPCDENFRAANRDRTNKSAIMSPNR